MDYSFSDQQETFSHVLREFAEAEVALNASAWDEERRLPLEIISKMGARGLFGLIFPETYGGSGADFTTFCLAVEELAKADSSVAITLSAAVGLGASPIYSFGYIASVRIRKKKSGSQIYALVGA